MQSINATVFNCIQPYTVYTFYSVVIFAINLKQVNFTNILFINQKFGAAPRIQTPSSPAHPSSVVNIHLFKSALTVFIRSRIILLFWWRLLAAQSWNLSWNVDKWLFCASSATCAAVTTTQHHNIKLIDVWCQFSPVLWLCCVSHRQSSKKGNWQHQGCQNVLLGTETVYFSYSPYITLYRIIRYGL